MTQEHTRTETIATAVLYPLYAGHLITLTMQVIAGSAVIYYVVFPGGAVNVPANVLSRSWTMQRCLLCLHSPVEPLHFDDRHSA